jgi:hypothetical protein
VCDVLIAVIRYDAYVRMISCRVRAQTALLATQLESKSAECDALRTKLDVRVACKLVCVCNLTSTQAMSSTADERARASDALSAQLKSLQDGEAALRAQVCCCVRAVCVLCSDRT